MATRLRLLSSVSSSLRAISDISLAADSLATESASGKASSRIRLASAICNFTLSNPTACAIACVICSSASS